VAELCPYPVHCALDRGAPSFALIDEIHVIAFLRLDKMRETDAQQTKCCTVRLAP
jgi:hypothetical protein